MRHLTLLVVVALATACANGTGSGDAAVVGDLAPVNGSGVEGSARFVPVDGEVFASIEATDLVPGRIHELALHAADGCPGPDAARDADRLADLEPYPTVGDDGTLSWELTLRVDDDGRNGSGDAEVPYTLSQQVRDQLSASVLVVYGALVEGRYRTDVPVACASLERATT